MKKSIALLLVCLLILPLPVLADAPSASLAGLFSALTQPTDGTVRYVSAPKWIFPDDDYNLIAEFDIRYCTDIYPRLHPPDLRPGGGSGGNGHAL